MRADRLVAALLVLQARGQVTAAELAAELEVSVRTARRDLEALAVAGLPVFAKAGRGGGWALLGGARTDLTGLTAAEARALFLLAGPSAAVSPAAKAALRKLVQAMPETFRAGAAAAASAVVVDPAGWGRASESAPPALAVLQAAVVDRVQVRLAYANRTGGESERVVHPLGVVHKGSAWYLLAGTDAGVRTFRVDRVRSAAVTGEPADRPDGFDLAAAWRAAAERTERRRRVVRATVHVEGHTLPGLHDQFGADMSPPRPLGDGRFEVEIRRASAEIIGAELAGWGRDVEVVEPPEVRAHLGRLGAELVARYGG